MEKSLLYLSQVVSDMPLDVSSIILKIFESGGIAGVFGFIAYMLWKELKEERTKNDQLTDKIITNNITMQEQLKDIIELLKNKKS